jgi:hypothetical protein
MDSHHHQGKTDNRILSRRARIEQKPIISFALMMMTIH